MNGENTDIPDLPVGLPASHPVRSSCAVANGLEILGDRWTLLIVRDLMFTNRCEFGHLLESGEGISTNILTDRLRRLQDYGLVEKLPHPGHGRKSIYRLTECGLGLAPTLMEFARWANRSIDGTMVPPQLQALSGSSREALLERLRQPEPLIEVDL